MVIFLISLSNVFLFSDNLFMSKQCAAVKIIFSAINVPEHNPELETIETTLFDSGKIFNMFSLNSHPFTILLLLEYDKESTFSQYLFDIINLFSFLLQECIVFEIIIKNRSHL